MLTLNDGRSELWQWDTGRTLAVDADCSQVHFSNKVFGRSIDVDVADGVAIIPDVLLQTDKDLNAWAFFGTAENGYTKISKTFTVNRRNKPADYVFTPPDQTSLEEIKEKLEYLESMQDPGAIKNAVEDYLEQNPVEAPVKSVNGQTGTVELTAKDVGAISQDDLQDATNKALAQAKESGEFDGKDGAPGADGKTPEYGVDYGTPEQIAEIAQQATEVLQPEVSQIKDDIAGLKDSKQDKLIAGTGITIAEDGNTISASGGEILIAHKVWADCYIELTPVEIDYENYTITVADASGVPLEISGNCVDYISITDWSGKNATFDIAPVELFPVQFFAIHVGDNRLQFYNSNKTLIQFTANDNVDINRFKIYVKKQDATRLSVTNLYQNHAYRIVMVKRGFNHFVSGFSIHNTNNRNWGNSYGNQGGVKSLGLGSAAGGNSFFAIPVNGYETFSLRGVHYSDTVTCSFFPSIIDVEIVPSKNGSVFEHWLHWRMSYVQRGSSTVKEIQYRYATGTLFMPYEIGSIVSNFGNVGNYFGNGTEMLVFDKGEWVE